MLEIKVFNQNKIIEGTKAQLLSRSRTAWASITNPKAAEWAEIAESTDLAVEDVKDLLNPHTRPIMRDLGQYTAVGFRSPSIAGRSIVTKPNVFLLSEARKQIFVINRSPLPAEEVVAQFSGKVVEELFLQGPTAILNALLEETIDAYRQVLDHINEQVDKIESSVLQAELSREITAQIFGLRKTLVYCVRALVANQEVVSAIEKGNGRFLNPEGAARFRTVYEDIEQLEDLATIYRELLSSSLEVHLSAVSNNLNVVMKRLTALAAIILIPSLIAGMYGMNLSWLPFATDTGGFFIISGIMLILVATLFVYFKKKDWL